MLSNNFINDATSTRFNQMALKTLLSDPQARALLSKASQQLFNKPLSALNEDDQQTLLIMSGFVTANMVAAGDDPVAGFQSLSRTLGTMPVNVMERSRSHSVFGMGNVTMGAAQQIQTNIAMSRSFADGAYNPARTYGLGMGMIGGMAAQVMRMNGTQAGDIREFAMQRTSANLATQMEVMQERNVLNRDSAQFKELQKTQQAMKLREWVADKLAAQLGEDNTLSWRTSAETDKRITELTEKFRTTGSISFGADTYNSKDINGELGFNIKRLSNSDVAAAGRMQKGTSGTFVTNQLQKRLDSAIDDVIDVVADLEGMLHTNSFDELQSQIRELGIGAITSKHEAERARDMLQHIERNAVATGRTKEQVIREMGTLAEIDGALNGGRVSTARVSAMQNIYTSAAVQESDSVYTKDEVNETAHRSQMNAQQQIQEVLFADYAFQQLGDNATKEQRATYNDLMTKFKEINKLPPGQRKEAMAALLPKFREAGESFGGNWNDEKYRALAASKSNINAMEAYSVGVHMMNNIEYSLSEGGEHHAGIMSGDKVSADALNAAQTLAEGFGVETDARNTAIKELGDIKNAQGADREAKIQAFRDKYNAALGEDSVDKLLGANESLDYSSMLYINNTVDSVSQVHATEGKYKKYNVNRAANAKIAADLASAPTNQGKGLLTNMIEGFLKTGDISVQQGARRLNSGERGRVFSLGALDENGMLDMDKIRGSKNLAGKFGYDIDTEEGRAGWEKFISDNNLEEEGVSALNGLLEKNGMILTTNDEGELAFSSRELAENTATEMQEKLRTNGFDIMSQIFGEDNLGFDYDADGNPIITSVKFKDANGKEASINSSDERTALNIEDTLRQAKKISPEISKKVLAYAKENQTDKRGTKAASEEYRARLRKYKKNGGKMTKEQEELLEKKGIISAEEFQAAMHSAEVALAGSDDQDVINDVLDATSLFEKNKDGNMVANANFASKDKDGKDLNVTRNGITKTSIIGDDISEKNRDKLNEEFLKHVKALKEASADATGSAPEAQDAAEGQSVDYSGSLDAIGKKLYNILTEIQKINTHR